MWDIYVRNKKRIKFSMNNFNPLNISILSCLFLLCPSHLTIAQAETNHQLKHGLSWPEILWFPPINDKPPPKPDDGEPPSSNTVDGATRNTDNGEPPNTLHGATRGFLQCPQDQPPNQLSETPHQSSMIALVPPDRKGLTVAEHPTIWLKNASTSAKQIIFNIRDKNQKIHFQTILSISTQSELIALSIPSNYPELEIGKVYEWSAILVCGESPHPDDPLITASIERVIRNPPTSLNEIEIAAWYAEQKIWYDTIDKLTMIKQKNPHNPQVEKVWKNFLKSAGIYL